MKYGLKNVYDKMYSIEIFVNASILIFLLVVIMKKKKT